MTVEFYSLYPDIREPELASPDLRGSLAARAARACTPVTAANGFGWYIYPPVDFAVRWDGITSEWSLLRDNEPTQWQSLAGGHDGKLPEAATVLAAVRKGNRPGLDIFEKYGGGVPFIQADPRNPHMLEVITGLLAKTDPGWWLLVREVPNSPRAGDHQILEGIIETDWYRAYLPTMVRLTQQNRIVRFHRNVPIMAAQPVTRETVRYGRATAITRRGIEEFPDDVWRDFVEWRRRKQNPHIVAGYQREHRERNKEAAKHA